MKKIKSFKIKNCEDCFFWQSPERIEGKEFCTYHEREQNQPFGINQEIRKESKDLLKWRITLWICILVFGVCLFCLLFCFPIDGVSVISMIKCAIYLPLLGWVLYDQEKDAKKKFKELNQSKSEWIIEYE